MSKSVISIIVIILAAILVDVFCGDVTNTRQSGQLQNNQDSRPKSPDIQIDGKSTTPWPTLGQHRTATSALTRNIPQPSRGPTSGPKKWVQQNNLWIRNEQAASGGDVSLQRDNSNQQGGGADNVNVGGNRQNLRNQQQSSGALNVNSNQQGIGGRGQENSKVGNANLGGNIQNSGVSNVNNQRGTTQTNINSQVHQTNRQQALIKGLGGDQQNSGATDNRRNTQTNTNSRINQNDRQQALINGLGGNRQTADSKPLGPLPVASGTPSKSNKNPGSTPNKPVSYAAAAGSKIPTPLSPTTPKTPPVSPLGPQIGGPKKDAIPSTGPLGEAERLDENPVVSDGDATDNELREFSEMLLRKDSNNAMKYVTINLQGMTSSRSSNDEAPLPLLKIEPDAYKIPSIEKMMLLYNNYFLDASQNEVYTGAERIEENNLLDAVLATPVMQYARNFLIQKGKIGRDPKEFKDLLRQIWFYMYSRGGGRIGSSGFEHIFLAEIKNNQVSGLHNWIYFNEEESQNRANYLGYLKKLDLGEKGAILKYHFTFHDIDKPVGSMFIGTSPELELALYSTCFVLRADKICPLKMNGNNFIIRTYAFRYRGKNMIGSAFPEI